MKPICFPCQRFYRMVKSGFCFIEGKPMGNGVELWSGDKWRCNGCGHELISMECDADAIIREVRTQVAARKDRAEKELRQQLADLQAKAAEAGIALRPRGKRAKKETSK